MQNIFHTPQFEKQSLLIHRAASYGEIETLADLIEEKKTNPHLTDNVRSF